MVTEVSGARKMRRFADQLVVSTKQNRVELSENELTKVSGGDGNSSSVTTVRAALRGEGRYVKIDF